LTSFSGIREPWWPAGEHGRQQRANRDAGAGAGDARCCRESIPSGTGSWEPSERVGGEHLRGRRWSTPVDQLRREGRSWSGYRGYYAHQEDVGGVAEVEGGRTPTETGKTRGRPEWKNTTASPVASTWARSCRQGGRSWTGGAPGAFRQGRGGRRQ
jgi:hypothetical protein